MSSLSKVEVSVFQKPKKGNYQCGDSYFYTESDNFFVCAIADGLGSGEHAKESSQIVIDIIQNNAGGAIGQLVKLCNEKLSGKRGVVVGILKLDFRARTSSFSSIGNIGMMTINGRKKKRNIPNGGYLAGYERPFKVVEEKLEPETNFIMFSDGVTDKELSERYLLNDNVHTITNTFSLMSEKVRVDDTTLIAIRYEG